MSTNVPRGPLALLEGDLASNFGRAVDSSLQELLNEVHLLVLMSVLDQVEPLEIFSVEVDGAFVHEVFHTVRPSVDHRIEDRGLLVLVKVISIGASFNKQPNDVYVPLASRVKNGGLAEAVYLVGLTPVGQEETGQGLAAVARSVEEASLTEVIMEGWITLALVDEVLGHFLSLLLVLDNAADK